MKTYEYKTIDIGFTPHPTSLTPAEILNKEGAEGWRLVAAVQRVGNNSDCIRHYFEREKAYRMSTGGGKLRESEGAK